MATENSPATEKPLVITRFFDAPRKLVWKAWTVPERMKLWWGPSLKSIAECNLYGWVLDSH